MKKIPLLIFLFISTLSLGQTDRARIFRCDEVDWPLHGAVASILDSTDLKQFLKINFVGHYMWFFIPIQGTISFSYVNDSVVLQKTYWSYDPEEMMDSCFFLKKSGSYIEWGALAKPATLQYAKTERDSASYKIINYENNIIARKANGWTLNIRVLDPQGRLVTRTEVDTRGQIVYKYEYKGDTAFINKYNGALKAGEYKVITKKIVRNWRVVTRSYISGREFTDPDQKPSRVHGVNKEVRICNWQKQPVGVKIKRRGRLEDESILAHGCRMHIWYYWK